MNAITLWQPWATLMADGYKTIETRSWYSGKFGPMAIHAGKHWDNQTKAMCRSWPWVEALPLTELPLGCVVAIGEFCACRRVLWPEAREADRQLEKSMLKSSLSEYYWGDFSEGRWLWIFRNVHAIEPVPAVGKQGIWKWEGKQ